MANTNTPRVLANQNNSRLFIAFVKGHEACQSLQRRQERILNADGRASAVRTVFGRFGHCL
jgi:hypothetical protein